MTKIVKAIYNGVEYEINAGGAEICPSVELLVVGGGGSGGGGGGCLAGGGGGGGGLFFCDNYNLGGTTEFCVVVGSGGARSNAGFGCNGGDSCFGTLLVHGGGGGGNKYQQGCCGGSGGGGGAYSCCNTECYANLNNAYVGEGNMGGYGTSDGYGMDGGGGGGAGGAGFTGYRTMKDDVRSRGGNGLCLCVGGKSGYFSPGGGGSSYCCVRGGLGGDGSTAGWGGGCCCCATDATWYGGGGGGVGANSKGVGGTTCSGAGKQGIVMIGYKTDGSMGINCATGGVVSTCGDYTIHCFTSDGTFCIVC